MPELPEVETIRRSLEPHLLGRSIAAARVLHPHVTGGVAPRAFAAALAGRRIERLRRRGKYMVFDLSPSEGLPAHLVCHLRMTGRLLHLAPRARWSGEAAHTHAVLRLQGGGRLLFHDVRKFGRLLLTSTEELPSILPVGRDPLLDGLTGPDLGHALGGRRGSLKALLLRQDILCGLGNIYADEALHRAGLHPLAAADLDETALATLAAAILAVLGEALDFRGTTLLDYRTGDGEEGGFAAYLRVYGRAGRPCRSCGTPVASLRVAGRTTAFCPHCQAR